MKVPVTIGSDHAGFELKLALIQSLKGLEYDVEDVGTYNTAPVDYPDYAEKVARRILAGGGRGVLICGSGVGAAIAANKIPGIRAGLVHDTYSAHQGVEHDDMNIAVFGSRVIGEELAKELMLVFLASQFSGEERHRRRLAKITLLEVNSCQKCRHDT